MGRWFKTCFGLNKSGYTNGSCNYMPGAGSRRVGNRLRFYRILTVVVLIKASPNTKDTRQYTISSSFTLSYCNRQTLCQCGLSLVKNALELLVVW